MAQRKNYSAITLPDSITQNEKFYKNSDRYTVINTESIIDKLSENGFTLHKVQEANTRKEENKGFQRHMVWMQHTDSETKEGIPSVALINSHNRSTGLRIYSGYIRFACENKLISGTDINQFSIRHKKDWQYDVTKFMENYKQHLVTMQSQREQMERKILSSYDEKRFTLAAASLRYDPTDYMDYRELGRITRPEDRGNNLWLAFNRIQENILKGEFDRRIITTQEDGSELETWGKAKIITAQDEIIRINRSLYDLAMKFAS